MHPNLQGVTYKYHTELYNLDNIQVIRANEKINSYELIKKADLVITFGSSIGIEACYLKKPVIALGGSFFYHLDYAYKPRTIKELRQLLKSREMLSPKPQIEALKYGLYMKNFNRYTYPAIYEPKSDKLDRFIGKRYPFLRLFGSSHLYRIFNYLINKRDELGTVPMDESLE